MSGITDGYYVIRIPDPKQPIEASANNRDNCAIKPVIIDGQMKVWFVQRQSSDGYYKMVLEENWYSSNEGNKVEVQTSVDPGTRWRIIPVKDDLYTIVSTNVDTAWTATHDDVILIPVVYSPDQLWKFLPVVKD